MFLLFDTRRQSQAADIGRACAVSSSNPNYNSFKYNPNAELKFKFFISSARRQAGSKHNLIIAVLHIELFEGLPKS